jgi:hypothetical protein
MWTGILNTIPSIANLPGQPGPIPGSNEIVTENLAQNIISENNQELITE